MIHIHVQTTPEVYAKPSEALCFGAYAVFGKGFASLGETCLS